MFCKKCGNKIEKNDVFCSTCGNKLVEVDSGSSLNREVLFEVKPTFRFLYIALPRIIKELMSLIPFILIIFIVLTSMNKLTETSFIKQFYIPIKVILIAIPLIRILYITIRLLIDKKQYDKITYTFYTDKVVFRDDFLNVAEKELKYSHIKEIVKKQTLVQRWLNIGNVIIFSNAESGYSSGIALVHIENIDEIYEKIKQTIYK